MNGRSLFAFIGDQRIGQLQDNNGIWCLAYDPAWVGNSRAYPLSPHLPLGSQPIVDSSSNRPVQWFFDNLLPEEGARTLLARDAKLDIADAFGLLGYYGAESAGSLTLLAQEIVPSERAERALSDAELQQRIDKLPHVPLTAGAAKRMSLAGAQHKLAVIYRDGKLFEPVGSTPSTHILKPNHADSDYPHTVINEYFAMRLASALRLDVPTVARRYVPAPVYLVHRFDRAGAGNGVLRLHLIDACQALNLDRQFKYSQGRIGRLAELALRCAAPAAARIKLYSWLAMNLLIGNGDAHLKNLSFLVTHEGVRPAPYYDLLATAVYDSKTFGRTTWPATQLAWPICGRSRFEELTRQTVLEAGSELGLGQETCVRLLDAQVNRIRPLAQNLLRMIEKENAEMLSTRPELGAVFAGETRCLRAIVELVIKEMAAKLAG